MCGAGRAREDRLGDQPDPRHWQETVIQHVKDARDRYGVTKRTLLAIRALFDGQISFADVFGR